MNKKQITVNVDFIGEREPSKEEFDSAIRQALKNKGIDVKEYTIDNENSANLKGLLGKNSNCYTIKIEYND